MSSTWDQSRNVSVGADDLFAFAAGRLSNGKRPTSVELVGEPRGDDDGKVRRAQIRTDQIGSAK